MNLTDLILVIENDKGIEINSLMNFDDYMMQYGTRIEQTPMELARHTLTLEKTKQDAGMWAELYRAANKSVGARYCYGLDQLCNFLTGVHNDFHSEHYLDVTKCSKECLELLEEFGIEKSGYYREGEEPIKDYDVEIKETLSRVKTIQASSLGEAIDKVMELYYASDIVLDAEDYKEVAFNLKKSERGR